MKRSIALLTVFVILLTILPISSHAISNEPVYRKGKAACSVNNVNPGETRGISNEPVYRNVGNSQVASPGEKRGISNEPVYRGK